MTENSPFKSEINFSCYFTFKWISENTDRERKGESTPFRLAKLQPESLHPERDRTQSLEPFESHPSTSSFDFDFAVRLQLRITPRSHPSTSPANPKPRSHIRLRRDRTPGSHRLHRDRYWEMVRFWWIWPDFTEFDEFFFRWVLFLCLSIEKWYYIFVWKLRKCEEQEENVFSILFSATQPNTRKYFPNHFLKCN